MAEAASAGWGVGARRWLVLGAAALALVPKLIMAATTYGTNDITHWLAFLQGVRQAGPIGVYGFPFKGSLYNHPPLIGYYLELIRAGAHFGLKPQFSIRAISSLADIPTALLVYELLRRRRSLRLATAAGVLMAISPVLITISGFHGNTDPVFTMLTLLSVYLLVDRRAPVLGGAAMALAIGVKIVPVIVLPCLVVYALTRGWRVAVRYVASFGLVSLVFWGPALSQQFANIRTNVFGYKGINQHDWGIDQLGRWAGYPPWMTFFDGAGRLLIVAFCALVPAVLVWRRPASVVEGAALALAGFLALSPTFGMQYLAWAAAATFLLSFWGGVAYNALAGALLVHVYTLWSGSFPWTRGYGREFTPGEAVMALVVWAVLCITVVVGVRRMLFAARTGVPSPPPVAADERAGPDPVADYAIATPVPR